MEIEDFGKPVVLDVSYTDPMPRVVIDTGITELGGVLVTLDGKTSVRIDERLRDYEADELVQILADALLPLAGTVGKALASGSHEVVQESVRYIKKSLADLERTVAAVCNDHIVTSRAGGRF